jgi:hypothetical protein
LYKKLYVTFLSDTTGLGNHKFQRNRGFPISCSKIGFKINALQEIILIK